MRDLRARSDVDERIVSIETPFGDEAHQWRSAAARRWLRDHADIAYPRLRARARIAGSPAVYAALADFGRAESVPVLARALRAGGPHADAAARALARQPQEAAGRVLRGALGLASADVRIAAADAILQRADPGDCAALNARLADEDAGVRYHVLQAGGRLRCIAPGVLAQMARTDTDHDVRELAATFLSQSRGS